MMANDRDVLTIDDSGLVELMELGERIQQELGIEEPEPDLEAAIERWRAEKAHDKVRDYRFVILIQPANGHFQARCPALDDCIGKGGTPDEARADLLTRLYRRLYDLTRQGQPIPTDESLAETIHVLIPAW